MIDVLYTLEINFIILILLLRCYCNMFFYDLYKSLNLDIIMKQLKSFEITYNHWNCFKGNICNTLFVNYHKNIFQRILNIFFFSVHKVVSFETRNYKNEHLNNTQRNRILKLKKSLFELEKDFRGLNGNKN